MTALYQNRALADAATEKLRVYAQPQRLMILSCLLHGEKTVGEIDIATSIGQPALSQQLAELRRANMVKTRRAAKQIYYALADDDTALCVRAMEAILGEGSNPAIALGAVLNSNARLILPPNVAAHSGAAAFVRIG